MLTLNPIHSDNRPTCPAFGISAFDPEGIGRQGRLASADSMPVTAPSPSLAVGNDQFEDGRVQSRPPFEPGTRPRLTCRGAENEQRIFLRLWLGQLSGPRLAERELLGEHEGGHLALFVRRHRGRARQGNRIVVRVDGRPSPPTRPPRQRARRPAGLVLHYRLSPHAFDFFPFCGIQRPVSAHGPQEGIADLTISDQHDAGSAGLVRRGASSAWAAGQRPARLTLRGFGERSPARPAARRREREATLRVPNAALWSPDAPQPLRVGRRAAGRRTARDGYTLPVGIRTVAVDGDALLLTASRSNLRGFGRHEDFRSRGGG